MIYNGFQARVLHPNTRQPFAESLPDAAHSTGTRQMRKIMKVRQGSGESHVAFEEEHVSTCASNVNLVQMYPTHLQACVASNIRRGAIQVNWKDVATSIREEKIGHDQDPSTAKIMLALRYVGDEHLDATNARLLGDLASEDLASVSVVESRAVTGPTQDDTAPEVDDNRSGCLPSTIKKRLRRIAPKASLLFVDKAEASEDYVVLLFRGEEPSTLTGSSVQSLRLHSEHGQLTAARLSQGVLVDLGPISRMKTENKIASRTEHIHTLTLHLWKVNASGGITESDLQPRSRTCSNKHTLFAFVPNAIMHFDIFFDSGTDRGGHLVSSATGIDPDRSTEGVDSSVSDVLNKVLQLQIRHANLQKIRKSAEDKRHASLLSTLQQACQQLRESITFDEEYIARLESTNEEEVQGR